MPVLHRSKTDAKCRKTPYFIGSNGGEIMAEIWQNTPNASLSDRAASKATQIVLLGKCSRFVLPKKKTRTGERYAGIGNRSRAAKYGLGRH